MEKRYNRDGSRRYVPQWFPYVAIGLLAAATAVVWYLAYHR